MKKFNAIDLFAGAGGLSLGLSNAGFNIILANEIEKCFCETYKLNHKNTILVEGDIRQLNFKDELKKINFNDKIHLVCGGPPCQGFSTVGKKEESDPRNNLFEEFIRVVNDINPDFVLFENVSGFKRMYNGRAFNELCKKLTDLKYKFKHSILNAVNFGLPQLRQRTIIVAYKKDFCFEMPEGNFTGDCDLFGGKPYRTLKDAISDLPEIESNENANYYKTFELNEYQKEIRNGHKVLTEHEAPKHGEKLLTVMSKVPYGGSILDVPKELRPKGYFNNTYARLVWEKPTPTMTRNFGTPSSSRCIHPTLNRGLTTREGARLQGFPDDYAFWGSKSLKNLQIGNAVPPVFGFAIGKNIFKSLSDYYG